VEPLNERRVSPKIRAEAGEKKRSRSKKGRCSATVQQTKKVTHNKTRCTGIKDLRTKTLGGAGLGTKGGGQSAVKKEENGQRKGKAGPASQGIPGLSAGFFC